MVSILSWSVDQMVWVCMYVPRHLCGSQGQLSGVRQPFHLVFEAESLVCIAASTRIADQQASRRFYFPWLCWDHRFSLWHPASPWVWVKLRSLGVFNKYFYLLCYIPSFSIYVPSLETSIQVFSILLFT